MKEKDDTIFLLFLVVCYVVITFFVRNNFVFWDSVLLASIYSEWYFEHYFTQIFVPEPIAGYPPLFGYYLATIWKIFGKNLPATHFAILPFLIGIIIQLYNLLKLFFHGQTLRVVLVLLLLEPTLLAQSVQISPDIILVFLFLLSLNSILFGKRILLTISVCFMAVFTPRSAITIPALFIIDIYNNVFLNNSKPTNKIELIVKHTFSYIPGFILLLTWLFMHYDQYGWVGFRPKTANSEAYTEVINLRGFLKNLAVAVWRLLDFGRVLTWIACALALIQLNKEGIKVFDKKAILILSFIIAPVAVYSFIFLRYTNPIGHRYLIIIYLSFTLFTLYLIFRLRGLKAKILLVGTILIGMVAGHFIVYPETISKGWDASLAHYPYYKAKREMISFIDKKGIPVSEIGAAYPDYAVFKYYDLSDDNRKFLEKNLTTNKYLYYTNISNSYSDEEIEELQEKWILIKEIKRGGVHVRLYKNPNSLNSRD